MLGFNAPVGARHTTLTTCIVYHAPAEKAREKGKNPGLFNNLNILNLADTEQRHGIQGR